MDRAISNDIQKRRRLRQFTLWAGGIGLLVLAVFGFRASLQTSLDYSRIRTAVTETGAVENTLTATGLVLPEFEEILTSPVSADLKEVLVTAGTEVDKGQTLLFLNEEALLTEVERLQDELALERNAIRKLELELEKSFFELQINDSIKALNINSLEADLENTRRLKRIGGSTQEEVDQAELELKIARLEKRKLENDLNSKRQSMQADLRERELEAQIRERALFDRQRKLEQTELTARRSGVITWVHNQIGATVREGEQLVKMADLNSYRVEGSISDLFADRVQPGMTALLRINDTLLTGAVTNIRPTVENDILTFDVRLDNPQHPLLRPNLRVETFIVTESRNNVVRIANGPAFDGRSVQELFILKDGTAQRRRVTIGLSNFDYVELQDGIQAGEEVIISDMSDYEHLREVRIVDSP